MSKVTVNVFEFWTRDTYNRATCSNGECNDHLTVWLERKDMRSLVKSIQEVLDRDTMTKEDELGLRPFHFNGACSVDSKEIEM